MTRKEMPPAAWLRAVLDEGEPQPGSEVPLRPEPPELQPPERKRSLTKRLVAWAQRKQQAD